MDMTLDGWVFIRVARQCLSKIKGYPYEVDSGDDTLLNANRVGGSFTTPVLSHHRAYGSVPRRFILTLELSVTLQQ